MKTLLQSLILLLIPCTIFGQEDFKQSADQLLQKAISENQCVGISAGIAIDNQIIWENAAGFSDQEKKLKFEASTLSRIASIVKPMTAIAIMQLYEQGKIDLDKPIQTYLPDFPKKGEGDITVKHLLAHASGIPAYASRKEARNTKNYPTLIDAMNIFKDRKLVNTPGEAFRYTSYGYVVLGLIIERVSKIPYERYIKENIWDKAGMTQTGIEYANKTYKHKTQQYSKDNKGKIKPAGDTNLSDRIPAGGMYSNVTDILKFGNAILSHKLIKESTLNLMFENQGLKTQGNGYGLGWYLYGKNPKYGEVYGHTGSQQGCSAHFMILPEQKTSIIVLSNTSGALRTVSQTTVALFDIAAQANE